MKKASNIWVRRGLLLHRLHGQELALALLLKQKPMSAPQIYSSLLEKEIRFDRKKIGKLLADLEWWGVVSNDSGVYSCQCAVLDNCQESYNESQLIDLMPSSILFLRRTFRSGSVLHGQRTGFSEKHRIWCGIAEQKDVQPLRWSVPHWLLAPGSEVLLSARFSIRQIPLQTF